jgi:hypothetical protein
MVLPYLSKWSQVMTNSIEIVDSRRTSQSSTGRNGTQHAAALQRVLFLVILTTYFLFTAVATVFNNILDFLLLYCRN